MLMGSPGAMSSSHHQGQAEAEGRQAYSQHIKYQLLTRQKKRPQCINNITDNFNILEGGAGRHNPLQLVADYLPERYMCLGPSFMIIPSSCSQSCSKTTHTNTDGITTFITLPNLRCHNSLTTNNSCREEHQAWGNHRKPLSRSTSQSLSLTTSPTYSCQYILTQ